jgi:hypothetical protein
MQSIKTAFGSTKETFCEMDESLVGFYDQQQLNRAVDLCVSSQKSDCI